MRWGLVVCLATGCATFFPLLHRDEVAIRTCQGKPLDCPDYQPAAGVASLYRIKTLNPSTFTDARASCVADDAQVINGHTHLMVPDDQAELDAVAPTGMIAHWIGVGRRINGEFRGVTTQDTGGFPP